MVVRPSADKDILYNGTSAYARNRTSLSMIATFFYFIKIYSTFQNFNCCIMAEILRVHLKTPINQSVIQKI